MCSVDSFSVKNFFSRLRENFLTLFVSFEDQKENLITSSNKSNMFQQQPGYKCPDSQQNSIATNYCSNSWDGMCKGYKGKPLSIINQHQDQFQGHFLRRLYKSLFPRRNNIKIPEVYSKLCKRRVTLFILTIN